MGINKKGEKTDRIPARHGAARQVHLLRRGLPRPARPAARRASFKLREGIDPQVYGIGLKELWDVKPEKHQAGLVVHTAGWPLDSRHLRRLVPLPPGEQPGRGRLTSSASATRTPTCPLTRNSSASRRHPAIRSFSKAASASPTARARSPPAACSRCPKLVFPGGALIGDDAGFLNASRIKGSHCGDQVRHARRRSRGRGAASRPRRRRARRAIPEPSARAGSTTSSTRRATSSRGCRRACILGTLMVGIDQVVFRGKAPWTLHHDHADHETLSQKAECTDRFSIRSPTASSPSTGCTDLSFSNTNHGEDQPAHLTLKDASVPVKRQSGEIRGSGAAATAPPASTSSSILDTKPRLQINAQNCVHCKTCDIKDPDAEHRLGRARGRRRAELSEHVTMTASTALPRILSLLPRRAFEPHHPPAALHRHHRSACSVVLHAFSTLNFWWLLRRASSGLRSGLGQATSSSSTTSPATFKHPAATASWATG